MVLRMLPPQEVRQGHPLYQNREQGCEGVQSFLTVPERILRDSATIQSYAAVAATEGILKVLDERDYEV